MCTTRVEAAAAAGRRVRGQLLQRDRQPERPPRRRGKIRHYCTANVLTERLAKASSPAAVRYTNRVPADRSARSGTDPSRPDMQASPGIPGAVRRQSVKSRPLYYPSHGCQVAWPAPGKGKSAWAGPIDVQPFTPNCRRRSSHRRVGRHHQGQAREANGCREMPHEHRRPGHIRLRSAQQTHLMWQGTVLGVYRRRSKTGRFRRLKSERLSGV
jgi:hypothetical protein